MSEALAAVKEALFIGLPQLFPENLRVESGHGRCQQKDENQKGIQTKAKDDGCGIAQFDDRNQYSQHKNSLSSSEKIQIELAKTSLIRDFEIVLPDINVLVNENHLQQYINSPDTSTRQLAIEGLKTFLSHKRLYLMARILNLEGLEQIRVEYYQGQPKVIPEQQLQDKSQCYYFIESIKFNMCDRMYE